MTREKAILHMILRREELKHSVSDLDEDIKAFDMAIEALEQEPCEDCISRQAAIDCITYDEEYTIECLKALPPVTPQTRWIPCSEKSPDKNEQLALLYDNGLVSGGKYLGDRTYDVDFPDQNKKTKVVAWMPIQPYKSESEDEVEVVTRGNCMICGKELTEGLFFCKECEDKANSRK